MEDIDLGFAEECGSEWLTNVNFPSKLGGKPAWLHLNNLPSVEILKCNKCKNQKSFLCQIYAPFEDEHNFHRMIYVFICRTESCYIPNKQSNITILRSQLALNNEFYSNAPPPVDGDAHIEIIPKNSKLCSVCGCLGPLRCGRCKKVNYCGTQHQRLHWSYHKLLCSTDVSTPYTAKDGPITQVVFPEWEIDMNDVGDFEESDKKPNTDEKQELHKLEQLTISGKAGVFQNLPESELEKYAQGCEEIDDTFFKKFRTECEKEVLQIIRYKRRGKELWISDPEHTIKDQIDNIPKCELCNEDRVFEFQLMPQMLNYLKDSSMDWGVVAVYTCPKSCPLPQEKGYVEEFCIKQDIIQ